MTESNQPQPTVLQLFRKWRAGDVQAGQEMAQKFSDWYYAISTIRIPDQNREPMENACQAFAQGIVSVTRPRALVDWAHDLLERELQAVGRGLDATDSTGSDNPNAMTRNRSPTELIQNVAGEMDASLRHVLALAYDPSVPLSLVDSIADDLGGTPYAMLQARYALKRLLQRTQDVPFAVAPDSADMDRTPISLYEAQRLASGTETAELEKWLLSDIDLCKDVAEFSAFVHALRGGALSEWAVTEGLSPAAAPAPAPAPAAEAPAPVPAVKEAPAPEPAEEMVAPAAPAVPEPHPDEHEIDESDATAEEEDDPEQEVPAPAPAAPAAPPQPAGSTFKAILITGATIVAAVLLLILVMIFALRAS